MTEVLGSVVVAESIKFFKDPGFHSAYHVLNVADVPCLPYVVAVDALARIWAIDERRPVQLQVAVTQDGARLAVTAPRYVRNMRGDRAMSGVETRFPIVFMASEEATYWFEVVVDGSVVARHPLSVRVLAGEPDSGSRPNTLAAVQE